jgi:hypothetical protein
MKYAKLGDLRIEAAHREELRSPQRRLARIRIDAPATDDPQMKLRHPFRSPYHPRNHD